MLAPESDRLGLLAAVRRLVPGWGSMKGESICPQGLRIQNRNHSLPLNVSPWRGTQGRRQDAIVVTSTSDRREASQLSKKGVAMIAGASRPVAVVSVRGSKRGMVDANSAPGSPAPVRLRRERPAKKSMVVVAKLSLRGAAVSGGPTRLVEVPIRPPVAVENDLRRNAASKRNSKTIWWLIGKKSSTFHLGLRNPWSRWSRKARRPSVGAVVGVVEEVVQPPPAANPS